MKIQSAQIQMASEHQAIEQHSRKESLRAWVGERRPNFETSERANVPGGVLMLQVDSVRLSVAATAVQPVKKAVAAEMEIRPEDDMRIQLLIRMIEKLTGKKIQIFDPHELVRGQADIQEDLKNVKDPNQGPQGSQSAGWGIEYDYYESRYEYEQTTFSAQGVIRTQDGQEIQFSVDLSMSREFMEQQSIQIRAGDARLKDPLVINFNGNAAQLTETKFQFDIDADGRQDQISFVRPDSGFLALDRNENGRIDDGSELFGALSGDGFGDLAMHDGDGNQWIDENDPIYSQLRIWSKDAQGQDQLLVLGEKGVGAIYLGHLDTPFSLKDGNQTLQGRIGETGVYLNEDGTAGTVQKIDLSV